MSWAGVAIGTTVISGGLSYLGQRAQAKSAKENRQMQMAMYQQGRQDLAPWREYGEGQLGEFEDWRQRTRAPSVWGGIGDEPVYGGDPTMEDVMSSPGYATRLGAIENSAAAAGGLFSGNALRDIGEFGASEYERTRQRGIEDYGREVSAYGRKYSRGAEQYGRDVGAYTDEYNRWMGRMNIGYGAAGGSAGLGAAYAPGVGATYNQEGRATADMYNEFGQAIGTGAGIYAGGRRSDQAYMDERQYGPVRPGRY